MSLFVTYRNKLKKRRNRNILLIAYSSFFAVAIIAPLVANELPLMIRSSSKTAFPLFDPDGTFSYEHKGKFLKIVYSRTDWNNVEGLTVTRTLIPWSPGRSDPANADYVHPSDSQYYRNLSGDLIRLSGNSRHLLGTSKRGEDVLSGLLHGTRISLLVGVMSMLIAGILGVILGSFAGYFRDDLLKIQRGYIITFILFVVFIWFYTFQVWTGTGNTGNKTLIFLSLMVLMLLSGKLLSGLHGKLAKAVSVPVDTLIMKVIEFLVSLPRLLLIIILAAILEASIWNLILIIGVTSWTEIARVTRAEMLKTKELDYIQAARASGLKDLKIIFRHALPNIIGPAIVVLTFGVGGAVLTEAGLSFLGIGVPQDVVTWGSMLADGKENFRAWWLVVFPGVALFLLIYTVNVTGEFIKDLISE